MALKGQLRLDWDKHNDAGQAVEVALSGEFDMATTPELTDALFAPEVIAAASVHVNLVGVSFLELSTVHTLVAAAARVRHAGGTFTISCDKQTMTWRIFEILRLADYLVGQPAPTREIEPELGTTIQHHLVAWPPRADGNDRASAKSASLVEDTFSKRDFADGGTTRTQEQSFLRPSEMTRSRGTWRTFSVRRRTSSAAT